MRRLKRMGFRRLGGKRGFTLIELLIVMVILAILAGIVIVSVGGVIGRGQETAYNADKESVQTAVLAYHGEKGEWPITVATTISVDTDDDAVTPPEDLYVIDMCKLTTATGADYLIQVPRSCVLDAGADNCDVPDPVGGACSCASNAHYIWAVDDGGLVYSVCMGSGCTCPDDATNCTGHEHAWHGFMATYP